LHFLEGTRKISDFIGSPQFFDERISTAHLSRANCPSSLGVTTNVREEQNWDERYVRHGAH
jgi:hypothetical protein